MILYIPDGTEKKAALNRTTKMCIAAHEDDVELMSLAVIGETKDKADEHFAACVVTDGASSPRTGKFANVTNDEMVQLRIEEQKRAADIGKYSAMALLGYSSSDVKTKKRAESEAEIASLIEECAPEVLYTHNPADMHETHVAVFCRVIGAIRSLPFEKRPKQLWGCEVWRSLDWLPAEYKTVIDSEKGSAMAKEILNVFESQVAGGKSYDDAYIGRQLANATFSESHACDTHKFASSMLDMSELLRDDGPDARTFINNIIEKFRKEIDGTLERLVD